MSERIDAYASPSGGYAGDQPDAASISVGQLVGEAASDLSKLMRLELELAKAEIKEEAKKAGKGAGFLGVAGYAGHLLILFLSLALMFALGSFMPLGWAALIVAVIWGIVAAVMYTRGRAQLKTVSPKPEQTIETLKEDAEWAKHPTR